MKRLWIAVGILLLILGTALGTGWWANQFTGDLTDRLEAAQELAGRGQWEKADEVTQQAYQLWQSKQFPLHVLMRHADTDQIYMSFREVEQFLNLREPDQYAAANAQLIAQLELLAEMEAPTLENVL